MNKKILSVVLAVVIVLCTFTACTPRNDPQGTTKQPITQAITQITEDTTSFKLSYSQSDSLNPFKSDTLNNQIVQNLVFESLFTIDEGYEIQPSIAASYNYTNKSTLVVTITSGLRFSNGDKISSGDVVYSFNAAKESPHWQNPLKAIGNATALSENEIEFNLNYPNPNAHKLLTFAIASDRTDDKGYPIGSGRYRFSDGNGEVFLEVNKNYPDFNPHFTKILLVNITSRESIENAINIGNISYAFRDLEDGDKVRMNCNKKSVNLNNLVYIGVNGFASPTSNESIRQAISLAIDRETLVKSSYQGYARSAISVFNTACAIGKQTKIFSSTADASAAKQAIVQSGLKGKELKLDILTTQNENKVAAAQLIKQQLEAVGFKVTINIESNKAYKYKVKSRSFDIYIGETKLSNDMNLNCFFKSKGTTHYGINFSKSEAARAYGEYLSGDKEIGKFILEFSQEMPFIPLLYRQGMICYSKSMHGDMQGYADNYFSNIQDWYYN